jgi:hypothetical protein
VFVALSDLVTASGYIMGSVLYLQMYWKAENGTGVLQLEETYPFNLSCTIQSAITTISNMWSFWWMAILALHLYLSAGYLQFQLSQKLLPYAAALATLVPVAVTTPALVTNWLGVGNGTASVCWCYIRLKSTHTAFYDVLEFVEGKLWEFLSFLIIFILLCHLKFKLRKYRKDMERSPLLARTVQAVPRHMENKLIAFPIVFFFIRLWGTIRYLLSWAYVFSGFSNTPKVIFISSNITNSAFLVAMQAIFDGSQGWVNALLFVLLSREGILRMKRFYLKLKHFSLSCRSACRGNPKPNVMDDNNCSVELADSQSLVPP